MRSILRGSMAIHLQELFLKRNSKAQHSTSVDSFQCSDPDVAIQLYNISFDSVDAISFCVILIIANLDQVFE